MPEYPPQGVAQNAPVPAAQALTPEAVSAVLADFRNWLTDLTAPAADEGTSAACQRPGEGIDQLLGSRVPADDDVCLRRRGAQGEGCQEGHGNEAYGPVTP